MKNNCLYLNEVDNQKVLKQKSYLGQKMLTYYGLGFLEIYHLVSNFGEDILINLYDFH